MTTSVGADTSDLLVRERALLDAPITDRDRQHIRFNVLHPPADDAPTEEWDERVRICRVARCLDYRIDVARCANDLTSYGMRPNPGTIDDVLAMLARPLPVHPFTAHEQALLDIDLATAVRLFADPTGPVWPTLDDTRRSMLLLRAVTAS